MTIFKIGDKVKKSTTNRIIWQSHDSRKYSGNACKVPIKEGSTVIEIIEVRNEIWYKLDGCYNHVREDSLELVSIVSWRKELE